MFGNPCTAYFYKIKTPIQLQRIAQDVINMHLTSNCSHYYNLIMVVNLSQY